MMSSSDLRSGYHPQFYDPQSHFKCKAEDAIKDVPIWQICRYAVIGDCRYDDIADIFQIQNIGTENVCR